jgi:putative nucleotidyltransferase with HDIG domain
MKDSDLPDGVGCAAEHSGRTALTLGTLARWPWNTVYLRVAIAGGVAAVLWSIGSLIATPIAWPFYILIGLTILSGCATLRLPNLPVSFSISDSFTITAALLFGPEAGAVAVAIDSLVISYQLARRNFGVRRLLFNAVAPALAMWTAAHCFFFVSGVAPLMQPVHSIGRLVGPLLMFAGLYFVLNTGLIAGAISLERRTSPLAIWRSHFLPLWLTSFGGAGVAALLITLMHTRGTNLVALGFVAPIPFIIYATFKNALGRMEDKYVHLGQVNRMYLSTIETLAHAIDAKDQVTHGHIRRVQQQAMRLARALGIEDEGELQAIDAASLLHDMGKLAVPEHILNKPGKLTAVEFEKMKLHATVGADILSSVDFPYPVVPIVRHHHERWDGGGYPAGLKGEAIPIGARILAVVDCFDALTSDRPYRPKMTSTDAIAILREWSGSHYEPRIVEKFVEIHAEEEPGEESPRASAAFSAITDAVHEDAARRGDAGPSYDLPVLEMVYELGAAMATASDSGAVIERLHDALRPLMPAACTVVYEYEPASDALIARYASGQHADALRGLAIPLGQRLTGWVAAQRSTVINSDAALDLGNLTMRLTPSPHTCLSTVLCVDGELVGVVSVYSTTLDPFTDRHGALLEVLAPKLAAAVRKRTGATPPHVAASSTVDRSTPSLLRFAR